VEALIFAGANPNKKDKDGKTPLHHAVQMQRPQIAKLLLLVGADTLCEDSSGMNPRTYIGMNPKLMHIFE
jgi:ankyrin repeat protein